MENGVGFSKDDAGFTLRKELLDKKGKLTCCACVEVSNRVIFRLEELLPQARRRTLLVVKDDMTGIMNRFSREEILGLSISCCVRCTR